MAYFNIKIYSQALRRTVCVEMFLPNDNMEYYAENNKYYQRSTKALLLLHGYNNCAENWVGEELARRYNFAVVMPNGENSFWLDSQATGRKFCTFIGEELIGYVQRTFSLAKDREDTCVMGLSMGGFGALHTAFTYPDTFSKVCAMSSALIVHEIARMKPGDDNGMANYEYYRQCFGELHQLEGSSSDPEALVKALKAQKKRIPEIFMSCGTEDFLLDKNRAFHEFLLKEKIEHTYLESPGSHDMDFWREYCYVFCEKMFG